MIVAKCHCWSRLFNVKEDFDCAEQGIRVIQPALSETNLLNWFIVARSQDTYPPSERAFAASIE
jgi:hypothetical protein